MIEELKTLRKLTKLIVDNPMEIEYNTIIKPTLDAIPYPIFIIDSLYNIRFANHYLLMYFNINADKIINKKYTDVLSHSNYFKFSNRLKYKKDIMDIKKPLCISEVKKFPIFNKKGNTVGYVCVVNIKQDLNSTFELKQSILYANSILSTTTFNSESIAIKCNLQDNLNITEVFSSINNPHIFSWLKGKSYINDVTYISDRKTIESYVKTLTENKNMMWDSRIYNKENNVLPVQQYMSLQNGHLLVHVASNDGGNIEIELS